MPDVNAQLAALDPRDPDYAIAFVDSLLAHAVDTGCSDVHLQPQAEQLHVRCRVDGVLQLVGSFPKGEAADVVTRLKVLSGLLTYQSDRPQEGRLRDAVDGIEMRVSTIPTVHGERAVVRLFGAAENLQTLHQLQLPTEVEADIHATLHETSGALLITGPAGSGKTTTAYACLRQLVASTAGGRSIVSLEDPVEVIVPGVAQSQANAPAGFDLTSGLKSLLRQDPEVIFIGEIRDRETADVAFQAALTGQLVISTFHAGSAAEAVNRLIEMDIEPYVLRSALRSVICQRLLRRLCACCETSNVPEKRLGLSSSTVKLANGCDVCKQTGYIGRTVIAEALSTERGVLATAVQHDQDAASIARLAAASGMTTLWERAESLAREGITSPDEVRRVLGWKKQ